MSVIPLPSLIVINSSTNHHHMPSDQMLGPAGLTVESVVQFLDSIIDESAPVSSKFVWKFAILQFNFFFRNWEATLGLCDCTEATLRARLRSWTCGWETQCWLRCCSDCLLAFSASSATRCAALTSWTLMMKKLVIYWRVLKSWF